MIFLVFMHIYFYSNCNESNIFTKARKLLIIRIIIDRFISILLKLHIQPNPQEI